MTLFDTFESSVLPLKNRLVMAPMTRQRASVDHLPTERMVTYYAQRASAGLIITEGVPVSPMGVGYPCVPGIYTPEQVELWKPITRAVHERGGNIFAQLWHVGRISHSTFLPNEAQPIAPSAVQPSQDTICYTPEGETVYPMPKAMTFIDIANTVKEFDTAAKNAIEAGFDGIEIHAANGYLIDQFLRDKTNLRTDEYGGPIENRVRFLNEIVQSVTDSIGSEKVGVRISPINSYNDIADCQAQALFEHVVKSLNAYNIAYLHVTEMAFGVEDKPEFNFLTLRELFNGIYMTNGGYTKETAQQALDKNLADLVAFGTPFIANPDLVDRFQSGHTLNEVDFSTCYGGGDAGYIDYPVISQE